MQFVYFILFFIFILKENSSVEKRHVKRY